MPGYRFALSVRVRREIYMVCVFGGFPQPGKKLALSPDRNVFRLIIIFRIDTLIVLTFAGDSTITRFFANFETSLCGNGSSGFPR